MGYSSDNTNITNKFQKSNQKWKKNKIIFWINVWSLEKNMLYCRHNHLEK